MPIDPLQVANYNIAVHREMPVKYATLNRQKLNDRLGFETVNYYLATDPEVYKINHGKTILLPHSSTLYKLHRKAHKMARTKYK